MPLFVDLLSEKVRPKWQKQAAPVERARHAAMIEVVHLKLFFGVALGAGILALGACTKDAERPDLPATLGNPSPVEVVGNDGVSHSSLQACEDFGTLSGSSAAIRLIGTSLASASFSAADRPEATKLTILASGDPALLVGKSTAVGTGDNANFATCTHCFVVAIGCAGSDCSRAALFYPRSGSATFAAVATAAGQTFEGKLENAELVQVTIDTQTQQSTAVAGGACIKVPSLDFQGTATLASVPPAGGTSGSSQATTSSTSTSSTSSSTTSGHGGSSSGGVATPKTGLL
jgi:hypothetical protein